MRINISIDNDSLKKINDFCETQGYKRSTVFLKGSLMFIDRNILRDEKGNLWIGVTPIKTNSQAVKVIKKKFSNVCEHGSMKGLCKKGCK